MDRVATSTDYARTFATIQECVAESLALDLDEVELQGRLIADLGADSLDFIDMIFMLEKKFGVKIREDEFDFLSRLDVSNPDVMKEGVLTAETVERLKHWLPALEREPDPSAVTAGKLFSLITVETLCRIVERKLDG